VADLVALGLTNREIASRLVLSERTVEWHIEQIFNKLGFSSRSQIAAWVGRSDLGAQVSVSGSESRGNLPAQFTSFVGRDLELRALLDLVTSNRLVTVTGAGGIGKTRLALRLAEELQPDCPDGVWLCELAPVAEPQLVGDAVAQALGVKRAAGDRLKAVREHLRDRSALLVLDNCEHLRTAAAAAARDLLGACPALRILATSRAPLGLIGEALFRLDPLPGDDAMHLFIGRAEAAVPNFRLGGRNSKSIATICKRLDGVPLAIELVVPRLRVQSAQELASAVLDPAWQARSEDRHGSLHAVTDWSYRLMDHDEQELFRSLGVFSGWFEGQDAAVIVPGTGTPVPVLLGALVEQSMLVQDQAAGIVRYRLLEILKAFALQQLKVVGALERSRLDHADHMVDLVERVDVVLHEGSAALRPKVTSMVDDVRAALSTLLRVDPARAAWLNACMMPTWRFDGRAEEGLAWSDRTLAANPDPSPERCWTLFQHAATLAELGRHEEAGERLHEAESFADSHGNEDLRRQTLLARAFAYYAARDFGSAVRVYTQAIDTFERTGEEHQLAVALNYSAMSLLHMGQAHEGARRAQRSMDIRRRIDPSRLAQSLDTRAQAHLLVGEPDQARACWLEAVERWVDTNWELSGYLFGLGMVAGLKGESEAALRFHFVAERLVADLNLKYRDPIAAQEAELMTRLANEVGQEVAERLQSESGALEPRMLVWPVRADS
jgi:predicted ATPase